MKFKDLKNLFNTYHENIQKIEATSDNGKTHKMLAKLKGDNVSIEHALGVVNNLFLCKLSDLETELKKVLKEYGATAKIEIESKKIEKEQREKYDIKYFLSITENNQTQQLLLGENQNGLLTDARTTALLNVHKFMDSVKGGENANLIKKYPTILDAFWHAIYIKLYTQQHVKTDEQLASLTNEKRLLIELIAALQDETKRQQKLVELKAALDTTCEKIENVEQITGDNLTINMV